MKVITNSFTDNYFLILKNLDRKTKLELIPKLSGSMLDSEKSKKQDLLSCFGSFDSNLSPEELITEIRNSRFFRTKEIVL